MFIADIRDKRSPSHWGVLKITTGEPHPDNLTWDPRPKNPLYPAASAPGGGCWGLLLEGLLHLSKTDFV